MVGFWRGVGVVALLLSMTVGFGVGAVVGLGGSVAAAPSAHGFSASISEVPTGDGWSLAQLSAASPTSVPDQESGLALPGATYAGTVNLLTPADPLATTPILISLDFSNGTVLNQLLTDLSNPTSPAYHHYLTHAEFDREFGGNEAVYRSLVAYFDSFGVYQLTTHPDRLAISFQATAAQVASIFHTDLGSYVSPAGLPYFAATSGPELPSLVAPYISDVSGLSDYSEYLTHTDSAMATEQLIGSVTSSLTGSAPIGGGGAAASPVSPGGGSNPFTPTTVGGRTYDQPVHEGAAGANCDTTICGQLELGADLQVAYNETGVFAKYGYPVNATVVAMLWSDPVCTANSSTCKSDGFYNSFCGTLTSGSYAWDFYEPDVTTYWNYTLPSGEPLPRAVPMPITGSSSYAYPAGSRGYSSSCDDDEAEGENTLDVAMEGSMAPGANVLDVFGQGSSTTTLETEFSDILSPSTSEFSTTGGFDTSRDIHDLSNASIIANSWGSTSSLGTTTTWINDLKTAQTLGISVIASTGDAGTNSLEAPAENSYNTYGAIAAGGTTLVLNPSTLTRTAGHLFSNAAPYDGTGGGEIVWYMKDGTVDGFTSTYGTVGGVTTSTTNYAPKWENSSADAHGVITGIRSSSYGRGEPDVSAIANDTIVDIEIGYFSANVTCTVSSTCTKVGSLPDNPAVEHGYTYFVGTSISAQVTGGMIGLIDYALHKSGEARVGFINPAAYAAGQLQDTSDLTLHSFFDITLFHNAESSTTYGAFAGWDADTGWGTIDAGNYTQNTVTYPITFTESGLPTGTKWTVTLTPTTGDVGCTVSGSSCSNPTATSSTGTTIVFNEPFGTYKYQVTNLAGYSVSPSSGTVKVNQAAVSVAVTFTAVTYSVGFSETGLPGGTSWTVTLAGTPSSSTGSSISFSEPNGTYSYRVSGVAGYSPTPSSGSVTVSGSSISVRITFAPNTYTVTFSESGLPSGETFAVTLNGGPQSVTTNGGTDSVSFSESNGTYGYSIAGISGWHQSTLPATGSVVVSGASVTEPTLVYSEVTYAVTFSETGLPGGTTWTITLNGVPQSSSTGSIGFTEPNGTFGYTVGGIAGYTASAYSGSVTVAGASASAEVTFAQVTYSVTFSERNLPTGATFSVTLNGATQSVAANGGTASVSFSEPNGTYSYSIAPVAGWAESTLPTTGSVDVAGSAVAEPTLVYVQVSYAVTFSESGLPSGTEWSATLNGGTESGTGSSIAFSEPNGSYGYSIGAIAGYTVSPSSGSVTVDGAAVSVSVTYTPVTYTVAFDESGLASGTSWSVTLGTHTHSSTTSTIDFTRTNGTYDYTVGAVAGYTVSPASGSVTVNGADVTVSVTYTLVTYSITFSESGLASGTVWSVTFDGVTRSTNGASLAFTEPNGTYSYNVGAIAGYTVTPSSGSSTVNGADVSVILAFSQVTYAVAVEETGLPSGTTWTVTLGGVTLSSNGASIGFTEPNGSYGYSVAGVAGYAATPTSGTVTVNGAATSVEISFAQVTYAVTFEASGLPSGDAWSVTLNGVTQTTTTSTIAYTEPNGSYPYSIVGPSGYGVDPASGSVTVDGAAASVPVVFTLGTFSVTFTETGLPSGTSWSVTLGITTESSTTATITFTEPNAVYAYDIGAVPGYTSAPSSGSVTVSGADVSVPVTFSPVVYTVTFSESGLPLTKSWSVAFDGTWKTAGAAVTISFSVPAGTYVLLIASNGDYRVSGSPAEGTLTIGQSGTQLVTFVRGATYTLAFHETGLATGSQWCVTVGAPVCATTATISVKHLTPGIYSYSVGSIGAFTTVVKLGGVVVPASGTTTIAKSETFKVEYTSAVTFTETGLPAGTAWKVTADGSAITLIGSSITFYLVNGSYSYHVAKVPGYVAVPVSGRLTVAGAAVTVSIVFGVPAHHAPASVPGTAANPLLSSRATSVARAG